MFTLFHLFQIVGIVIGLICGIFVGKSYFGWFGIVFGGLLGVILGLIFGKIPFWVGSFYLHRELQRSSTETLKQRLEKDYFISHLIIAELVRRGETWNK